MRFVNACLQSDLFGPWVPQEWIDRVLEKVRGNPEWTFLFVTKFPQRMATVQWPDNAWPGVTVNEQRLVETAEDAFSRVAARVKHVWVMPMMEPIIFNKPEIFDWFIVGGIPDMERPFIPPPLWVDSVARQAHGVGAAVCEEFTEGLVKWYWESKKGICGPDPRCRELPYFDDPA